MFGKTDASAGGGGSAELCISTKTERLASLFVPWISWLEPKVMGAQESKTPGGVETGVEKAGEAAASPSKANGQVEEDFSAHLCIYVGGGVC